MANKEKLLDSAQKFLSKGQVAKAIGEYQKLIAAFPKDVRNRQKLAELLCRDKRNDESLNEYETVAKHYTDTGFYLKAIAVFKQMQKIDASRVDLYLRLAELNEKQGLIGNALSEYRNLVDFYGKNAMHGEAIDVLGKMVALDPENLNLLLKIAECHKALGQADKAFEFFGAIIARLDEKQEYTRIVKLYDRFLDICPEGAAARLPLGRALQKSGASEKAIQVFKSLLKQAPDDYALIRSLTDAYVAVGDLATARITLKHLLKQCPDDLDLHEAYLRICLDGGETEQARDRLEEWKDAFFQADRIDVLLAFYEELRTARPEDELVGESLALICEAVGVAGPQGREEATKPVASAVVTADAAILDEAIDDVETLEMVGEETAPDIKIPPLETAASAIGRSPAARFELELDLDLDLDLDLGPTADSQANVVRQEAESEDVAEETSTAAASVADSSTGDVAVEMELDLDSFSDLELEFEVEVAEEEVAEEEVAEEEAAEEEVAEEEVAEEEVAEEEAAEEEVAEEEVAEEEVAEEEVAEEFTFDFVEDSTAVEEVDSAEFDFGDLGLDKELPEAVAPAIVEDLEPLEDLEAFEEIEELEDLDEVEELEVLEDLEVLEELEVVDVLEEIEADAETPAAATVKAGSSVALNVDAELEEAEFYLQQGLYDDAERVVRTLLQYRPGMPELQAKIDEIQERRAAEAVEPAVSAFTDLMADLHDDELLDATDFLGVLGNTEPPGGEFTQELASELDSADTESHFNLGIAYKEMGLHEDAIAEFEKASADPGRLIDCITLTGQCYMESGATEAALEIFKSGLTQAGPLDAGRKILNFELGLLYQGSGQLLEALESYQLVAEQDSFFRDVGERIKALRRELGLDEDSDDDGPQGNRDRVSYV